MSRIGHSEIPEKLRRVRALLEEKELDGLIIGRKDNFAWLTC